MKVFKDIKRIVNKIAQIQRLAENLETTYDFDCCGIDWYSAVLVSGLKEKPDGLYNKDGFRIATNEDDYYCAQTRGYLEDDYYGNIYFKTDVPGQFVKVWFQC